MISLTIRNGGKPVFDFKANKTSIKTEVVAGTTTFFTMAYIMVVNPLILSDAGVSFEQSFTATIIAAVIGTLLMGLVAKYPIAVAPGMGLNAYFTYSVVQGHENITYIEAFSAVFVAGLLFLLMSLTPLRSRLIEVIPANLKHAITVGIGLFIAFIGLRMSGIITAHPDNLVTLGDLHEPSALLTLAGLAITLVLMARKIKGAIFIGIVATGIIAYFTGMLSFDQGIVSLPTLPEGIIVWNPIEAFGNVISHGLYAVVFSFLLVTLFDTTGTVVGVAEQAGLMKDNKLPRSERAMLSDSIGTVVGACTGTSTVTTFAESTAGVAAGGRTGLTSLTCGIMFLLCMFIAPIAAVIPPAATSAALIFVGVIMLEGLGKVRWRKFEDAVPIALMMIAMPVSGSIGHAIGLGLISFSVINIFTGNANKKYLVTYIISIIFLISFFLVI